MSVEADIRHSGEAVIEKDFIVIRVAISALPMVVEGAWATNNLDTRYQLTKPAVFAKDLVHELNREDEDGTTPIHTLFDKAVEKAIEQGAEGIEQHPDQER